MLKQELRKRSCIRENKGLHSRPACRCVELLNVWRTCNTSVKSSWGEHLSTNSSWGRRDDQQRGTAATCWKHCSGNFTLGNEKLLESWQHVAHELTWKLVRGDNAFLVFCSPHCCDVTRKCAWSFRDSCDPPHAGESDGRKMSEKGLAGRRFKCFKAVPQQTRTCQLISAGNTGGWDCG